MEGLDVSVFAWGRVIERLFIVGFSGMSMLLGWNLFVRGVVVEQEAEGVFKDWKITLRKVGPGVFFALFGSAVLVFALNSPLTVAPGAGVKKPNGENQAVITYFQKDSASLRKLVRTVNTLLAVEVGRVKFDGTPVVASEYAKAQSELIAFRYRTLLSQFSASDLDAWTKYGAKYSANPDDAPPELREALGRVKPWFDETLAMEVN